MSATQATRRRGPGLHDVKLNAFVDRPELGRAGREVAQPHRKVRWKPRTWPSDATARDPVAWRVTSPRHPRRVDPRTHRIVIAQARRRRRHSLPASEALTFNISDHKPLPRLGWREILPDRLALAHAGWL